VAQRKPSTKTKSSASSKAKGASHKTKSSSKPTAGREKRKPGDKEVTIDRRRGHRRGAEAESATPAPQLERRKKVNRRRQIDPTTCERDYTDDEIQFMNALEQYKRTSGRMFPTCSEVLEVVRSLGYVKLSPSKLASRTAETPTNADEVPTYVEIGAMEAESADAWQ
jgi:hypothetical protein